ncbi:hypothetical protein FRC03_010842 [Tulasnella sp. 419]|nr:hypothetical protein FRC03_010842 [Tulasnella sp. 419]
MPGIAYAFVLPVARQFLAFLEKIMTSDDGQNSDTLLPQLYPHAICLLLRRDHDVWFEELCNSNHLNRFRSLLASQPSNIPLSYANISWGSSTSILLHDYLEAQ